MPPGAVRRSGVPGVADGLMLALKMLLSLLLLFFAVLVLFGGAWDWSRPLAALVFVALALLAWTMHFPVRVRSILYGMLLIAAGCCFLYGAVLVWNGSMVFPENCSSARRVLGCHVLNAMHAAGGAALVGGFFALLGVTGLVVGRRFIAGRASVRSVE